MRTSLGKMVGRHQQLNGHEFEHTLADDKGRGSLACCSPWGHKESETTERLNKNNNPWSQYSADDFLTLNCIFNLYVLSQF